MTYYIFRYFAYRIVKFSVILSALGLLVDPICNFSYGSVISPVLSDPNFRVETIVTGLEFPTGLAFLGPDDILVLEKDKGTVHRILNGQMVEKPLLDVNVANEVERGMLGIAVTRNDTTAKTYVFLFYTEAEGEDSGEPVGNRLYRYELDANGNMLVNPKLLLDLPYLPGPAHNGGVVTIGPDNNVYVVIGNLFSEALNINDDGGISSLVQNVQDGEQPDGRAGILRVTQDGKAVNGKGILGEQHPLNMYYAYGIRNSFGIAFDPISGNLWDTENGGYDEINLVEPGFNSGFSVITGSSLREDEEFNAEDLVDFNGNGKYSDPKLDMGLHIAPTAITFLHSDKLGKAYENDMFVGNTNGKIYRFALNGERTELILEGDLADKMSDDLLELEEATFGEQFDVITDLEVGPDGYLYVLNYNMDGSIFRILPELDLSNSLEEQPMAEQPTEEESANGDDE
jgi:glucose/arabinose dehydrogenase